MQTVTISLFLAYKAIRRTGWMSRVFIVLMMALTFLNLLVVRGVLVGIPDSALTDIRQDITGDIQISKLDEEREIKETYQLINYLDTYDEISAYSVRYQASAVAESDYGRSKKEGENASRRTAVVFGINPDHEEEVTEISRFIADGRMLQQNDTGRVVMGTGLLADYSSTIDNFIDEDLLQNVTVGSRVLLTIAGYTKEYEVVGVVDSKQGQIQERIFMLDRELRQVLGKNNLNASEISLRLSDPSLDRRVAQELQGSRFGSQMVVETSVEAAGEFLEDIKTIFDFLSIFIGLIGVVISGITIFIVIFINVMSRRKEVGVMRAIGVPKQYIGMSYFFQSIFYALSGIALALVLFFGLIEPYFQRNPINFPFTDVYLSVSGPVIMVQIGVLLFAAFLAGYIPSRIVIKRKILALLLGR